MNIYIEDELSLWLENRVGQENFKPGLERIASLFEPVINDLHGEVITIGGTNGKGSVSFNLEKQLLSSGASVALWSSPHILTVRERFRSGGRLITVERLSGLFEQFESQIKNHKLSYYEFLFLVFCHFAKNHDFIILEVGLGGRFDAVNLLNPTLTAITSIGRDHQAILGESYRAILGEKLGITRLGVPLLTSFNLQYLCDLTQKYCFQGQIPWQNHYNADYRRSNAELACELAKLALRDESLKPYEVPSKGRFEKVRLGNLTLTFVGSHNLAGMREMISKIDKNEFDLLLYSFSKRDRKEIESCIKLLQTSGIELALTSFDHPKAAPDLAASVNWKDVINMRSEGSILITGSYYFVGEVQKYILTQHRTSSLG